MTIDVTCRLTVSRATVQLELPDRRFSAPIDHSDIMASVIHRLDRFVRNHPDAPSGCEKTDLALLGAVMFETLFGGEATELTVLEGQGRRSDPLGRSLGAVLRDRLDRFEALPSRERGRFRIGLAFDDTAGALATYPWEFMFVGHPAGPGFFLGEKTSMMRMVVPSLDSGGPRDKLDVLVAWASPRELGALAGAGGMAEAIGQRICGRIDADVRELPDMSWPAFCAEVRQRTPDILHLIAHGRYLEKTSALAFRRSPEELARRRAESSAAGGGGSDEAPRDAAWISIEDVAAQFSVDHLPRLVFLHACNLGRAAPDVEAFRGAAEVIARKGVPFVIAMQYEITNEDAEIFTNEFYRLIGQASVSVDEAVRSGRTELGTRRPSWSHRRFATPVVYLRDESARLALPRAERPADPPAAAVVVERSVITAIPQASNRSCPFENCERLIKIEGKLCGCERQKRFELCRNNHPNKPEDSLCWRRDCSAAVMAPVTAAAPARLGPNDMGEA